MAQKAKPVHEIQLGRIRAAIWANHTEAHGTWFNVTVTRRYKEADRWQDTTSFGRDDLPIVAKAADMAYAWILGQHTTAHESEPSLD